MVTYTLLGQLVSLLPLCSAFGASYNSEYGMKKRFALLPGQLIKGVLPIVLVEIIFIWIVNTWRETFIVEDAFNVLELIRIIAIGIGLLIFANASSKEISIKDMLKRWYLVIFILATLVAAAYVGKWCDSSIGKIGFADSVYRIVLFKGIFAIIQWVVYLIPFRMMAMLKKPEGEGKAWSLKARVICNSITAVVCGVAAIIFLLLSKNEIKKFETVDYRPYRHISKIDSYLSEGDEAFTNGDFIKARLSYDYAVLFADAWKGYLTDKELLKGVAQINNHDEEIAVLLAFASENASELLKSQIAAGNDSLYMKEALLQVAKGSDRDKLLDDFIDNGIFKQSYIFATELTKKDKNEMLKMLESYNVEFERRKIVDVYYYRFVEGGASQRAADIACELANNNPEDMAIHAFAIEIIGQMRQLKHINYDNTVVDRYAQGIAASVSENLTEEDINKIIATKTLLVEFYMGKNTQNKDVTNALNILDNYFPEVNVKEMDSLRIDVMHIQKKYDEALELAKEYAKKYPEDARNNAYLSIGMLPRDPDVAIDSIVRIAEEYRDAIAKGDKELIVETDVYIGTFLEYAFGYYSPISSTFCSYKEYYQRIFTDEQKQKLLNDETLSQYIVMWETGGGNAMFENPKQAIVEADKILEKYSDLSFVLYIKGFNQVNTRQYKEAIVSLEKSIELYKYNPFVREELATAYSQIGEYEKALEITEEMEKMLNDMGYMPASGYTTFKYDINEFKKELYEAIRKKYNN